MAIELTREAFDRARELGRMQFRNECWPADKVPVFEYSSAYVFTPRGEDKDLTVVVLRCAPPEVMRVNLDDAGNKPAA